MAAGAEHGARSIRLTRVSDAPVSLWMAQCVFQSCVWRVLWVSQLGTMKLGAAWRLTCLRNLLLCFFVLVGLERENVKMDVMAAVSLLSSTVRPFCGRCRALGVDEGAGGFVWLSCLHDGA